MKGDKGNPVIPRICSWLADHVTATGMIFVLVTLLSTGVGALFIMDLSRAAGEAKLMHAEAVDSINAIAGLQFETQEARRSMQYALTTTNPNQQLDYVDRSRAADKRIAEILTGGLWQTSDEQELKIIREFEGTWKAYLSVRNEIVAAILEGSIHSAIQMDGDSGTPAFNDVLNSLESLKLLTQVHVKRRLALVEKTFDRSMTMLILILTVTQALAFVTSRMARKGKTRNPRAGQRATFSRT